MPCPSGRPVLCIRVAPETSVLAAIEQSGILQKHPRSTSVGQQVRYLQPSGEGRRVGAGGDRIEIYRPLIADPKEMRKKRAEKPRKGRADGGHRRAARCAPQARRCRHLTGDGL